ncbi:DUF397 domain-containing protein [Amycolatopsis sp. NPDC098790]|uniref:DUF397 domain-containing protein n=1 Tax=Amycolatopsis sp. NPDC098790 TaxID=3363939 RepID=UPI00380F5B61
MGREGLMTGRLDAPAITVENRGISWLRSSRCHPTNDPKCTEVALTGTIIRVRDSKSLQAGELHVSRSSWAQFLRQLSATAGRNDSGA